ncbi:hypothetical protein K438DRAFT_1789023 [Mycena galopus ATCC 62051]|nr:hypothetical protein K438DRAFT_1789023 [Mycena galopus ATCC 62051]
MAEMRRRARQLPWEPVQLLSLLLEIFRMRRMRTGVGPPDDSLSAGSGDLGAINCDFETFFVIGGKRIGFSIVVGNDFLIVFRSAVTRSVRSEFSTVWGSGDLQRHRENNEQVEDFEIVVASAGTENSGNVSRSTWVEKPDRRSAEQVRARRAVALAKSLADANHAVIPSCANVSGTVNFSTRVITASIIGLVTPVPRIMVHGAAGHSEPASTIAPPLSE